MTDQAVHRWLLCLCDPDGQVARPATRLASQQLATLVDLAEEHGVAGILAGNLRQLSRTEGADRVLTARDDRSLEAAIDQVNRRWLSSAAFSLMLRQRAAALLQSMRDARLQVAVVKGEDFADRLYSQPGVRTFRDIDLMLTRKAADAAEPVLQGHDFRRNLPGGKYNDSYGERTWDSHSRPTVRVELHWDLITCPSQRGRSSLAFDQLAWEACEDGQLRATPSSMLLIACVHAAISHRFDRLQHLCDIRQVCREKAGVLDIDWLREAIINCGVETAVAGALAVTGRILNHPQCLDLIGQLRLSVPTFYWRWLVSKTSLLHPETRSSKFRRTVTREWLKRAA